MKPNGQEAIARDDHEADEGGDDAQKDLYLTFRLGAEDYGIEIRHVTEIVGLQKITGIPDVPEFVKGVINLRGSVIPVIDVRIRFGMPPREYDDRTCVIVAGIDGERVGFVVDAVNEVAEISGDAVEAPPQLGRDGRRGFIMGLGKVGREVKILLDVNKLLYGNETERLTYKGANDEDAA